MQTLPAVGTSSRIACVKSISLSLKPNGAELLGYARLQKCCFRSAAFMLQETFNMLNLIKHLPVRHPTEQDYYTRAATECQPATEAANTTTILAQARAAPGHSA